MGNLPMISLAFLVIAAGLFGLGYVESQAAGDAVESAVEVEAEIVDTDIEMVFIDDLVYYRPIVVYEYSYEGKAYRSSGVQAGTDLRVRPRAAAQEVLEEYPVGSTTTAYVVPDDPETSFLEAEESGAGTLRYLSGAVFGLLGVILGVIGIRQRAA